MIVRSSSERPLRFRIRPDLEIRPLEYQRRRFWVLQDPIGLKHYFITDQEHTLLRLLDGRTSVGELQHRFTEAYPPQRLGAAQIQAFLVRLQREGLLVSAGPDAATTQLRRQSWRQLSWKHVGYWLAYRIPILNPDPILRRLVPYLGWLFRLPAVTALLLAGLLVAAWIVIPGDLPASGKAAVEGMLAGRNLVLLAVALFVVRALHEWGHALACRAAGRSCSEMGVTLLMGMPVLYCDVSSAWTLNSKWKRMAISAAGMYVEWIVAAACLVLWYASKPGLFQSICLNIVLVCSVGTLLLNGNPLMRYDGYYLLADWLEIPNLDHVGRAALKRRVWTFLFGVSPGREHLVDRRRERWCAVYAVLASAYRMTLLLGVLGFLYLLLEPHRLERIVVVLGCALAAWLIGERILATGRELAERHVTGQLDWRRFSIRSTALLLLVASLLWVPLPHRVRAPAVFEPQIFQPLYVTAPGRIQAAVTAGQRVAAGEVIVQLENPELHHRAAELATERKRLEMRLQALEARRGMDPRIVAQIPATRQACSDFQRRWERAQEDADRLSIRAEHAGIVLAPPARPAEPQGEEQLGTWSGTPLDPENRGAWLEPGTPVAVVAPAHELVAVAVVEQYDLPALEVGQQVHLRLVCDPGRVRHGRVIEIARRPLDEAPLQLAAAGEVLVSEAPTNEPLVPSYQVRIELLEPSDDLLPGARARCRIIAPPRSCAQRLYAFFRRTFAQS